MQWVRDYHPQPEQAKLYTTALTITLGGNLVLAATKGVAAYLSGSVAIFADAANSASDVLYSLLMVLGLWMAQRPPDLSHPQGHSRFEPLVGLMVTLSMAFAGYSAASEAYNRFVSGGLAVEPGLPTLVLLASAAIKAGMFLAIRKIAMKLGSPTLATTAQDNLSDVLTSTAAFIGVIGSDLISPLTDPIAGFLVAAWIFRSAFNAGRENLKFLTGAGADPDTREEIIKIVETVPGVERVHHMLTEYVGPGLIVDLHVNCDGDMTLNQAHTISDEIITQVEKIPQVDRAYVHIEPHDWQE